jgi:hypothetical protein
MSNYTKLTAYDTKDGLTTGDPLKRVKGTELDDEFDAISTAIATKANSASPEFTGTPTVPTATFGVNTTQAASTAFVQAALAALYPVGSVYINATSAVNPATLLGFGTWSAFAAGRVLVGLNAGNALFDTAEETGGSANAVVVSHSHTATSTVSDPGHSHTADQPFASSTFANGGGYYGQGNNRTTGANTTGITVATSVASSGSSGTNANYQPYITVYMWKRTA